VQHVDSPEETHKLSRLSTVIKLKQVEHVRNERNVLAAVAGHPFITTLITSFSDETTLYMLVCDPLPPVSTSESL
jgi:hypothetical protein